jgi:hypothetical protein
MQVVVYNIPDGGVAVVRPARGDIEVAVNDVPNGIEYAVMDDADLPDEDQQYWVLTDSGVLIDETARDAVASEAVRKERDRRLREGDRWVLQLARQIRAAERDGEDATALDAELAAWDAHQTALCDVPEQPGFPTEVEWPVPPAE